MSHSPAWLIVPALIAPAALVSPAYAVQYLTTEAAQKVMFPDASAFVPHPVRLTDAQKNVVENAAKVRMHFPEQPVWQVMADGKPAGWFVLDEVYGKHEFITYAVALDASGAVRGVEILDYRETHGGEIRNPKWRAQFNGARHGAALKLDGDIQNISGATLSCKHIAEGVRRVLAIHAVALK
jgi:Na+-transporting NADH:ubiquinone oxidoreductase subunit C